MQTGLTLLGIGLLGYLLVFAARRVNRGLPKGPMELLATLRLEQRRALYLVRIANRTVVLGASEGGMVTVLELDSKELDTVTPAPPAEKFSAILSRVLTTPAQKRAAPPTTTTVTPPGANPSSKHEGKDSREPNAVPRAAV